MVQDFERDWKMFCEISEEIAPMIPISSLSLRQTPRAIWRACQDVRGLRGIVPPVMVWQSFSDDAR